MSKKCRAYSKSKLGLEPPDNRKAFYAGWDAALRAALEQEQGEPVAWMNPSWINPDTRNWPSESFESLPVKGWMPLYTFSPQRKPLTDEEIKTIHSTINWHYLGCAISFARAIERAHGIGGEE